MPRTGSLAALLVLLALLPGPARADVGGPAIVGFVNAQRAANGIPAGIVEDAALSDGCAKHNAYEAANQLPQPEHSETPGNPGFTPEGDAAAQHSVLYGPRGGPWTETSNPFEAAPIHLHQLLAPRLDRAGAAETGGWGCFQTLASRSRPAPPADVTYTYPGDGQTGWPASQVAREGPYTPGQLVGIPQDAETGPYLYVLFDGPDLTPFDTASATGATLVGPAGPVDVVSVDNTTPGLAGYLPTGMELIPRRPLTPHTTYTASVSADVTTQGGGGPARAFTRTWSFTTGDLANAIAITGTRTLGREVTVAVSSTAPDAYVFAAGPEPTTGAPVSAGSARLALPADGTWQICAVSGGGTSGYASASDCVTRTVEGPPATTPDARPPRAGRPGYTRRGRRVTVRWTRVPGAVRYRVLVTSGGRGRTLRTRRLHVRFRLAPTRSARVRLRGVSSAGVAGPRSPRLVVGRLR